MTTTPSELERVLDTLDEGARCDLQHEADAARLLREMARDFVLWDQLHRDECGIDGSEECTCGLTAARERWRL